MGVDEGVGMGPCCTWHGFGLACVQVLKRLWHEVKTTCDENELPLPYPTWEFL